MIDARAQKNERSSTDASVGRSLRARVEMRKAELETAIAKVGTDKRVRGELEIALAELDGLLTGNLDHIPKVIAAELNTWLEANKHVDEHHPSTSAPVSPAADLELEDG
jgi:O-succinylbenzoate synthase